MGTPSGVHHRFTTKEPDWGFTYFCELSKLFQPQPGCDRPVIEEDSTLVSAYVRVLEDPGHRYVSPYRLPIPRSDTPLPATGRRQDMLS